MHHLLSVFGSDILSIDIKMPICVFYHVIKIFHILGKGYFGDHEQKAGHYNNK